MGNGLNLTHNNHLEKSTGTQRRFTITLCLSKKQTFLSWKSMILIFILLMPYAIVSGVRSNDSSKEGNNTLNHITSFLHGNATFETNDKWVVICGSNQTLTCWVELNSSYTVIQKGLEWTETIFRDFYDEHSNLLTVEGLTELLKELNILYDTSHSDDDHDHRKKRDVDDDDESYYGSYYSGIDALLQSMDDMCLKSVDDLLEEYYPGVPHDSIRISLSDFAMIVPRILFELQSVSCKPITAIEDHDKHEHDNEKERQSTAMIWLIALVSVLVISMLSVVGIMIVPLMRHSNSFHRLLSFLVALAVGTLVGDALLHLLPHAMAGEHHNHSHGAKEEKDKIVKNLVAVLGIYLFFIFESAMSMIRKRRNKKKCSGTCSTLPKLIVSSLPKNDDVSLMAKPAAVNGNGNCKSCTPLHESPSVRSSNGILYSGVPVVTCKTPPFPLKLNLTENTMVEEPNCSPVSPETPEGFSDPHHLPNNHHHHHHHRHDLSQAQTVKDLAWMVIAGDGLHNFSDGLAIGAAFTSSVSAGLSTSLAIFCHELPHEFGDFAILIDAGMSIKKALGYNVMSACVAFIGAVIGLVIGEYTDSVKVWILAITAGGFLYVGLVDMLPQMLHHCVEKEGTIRFFFQNVGFIFGIVIMLLIAWYEDSFLRLFNVPHGH